MKGLVLRWCCMFFDNQWLLKVVANVSARSSSLPRGVTDRCKIPYTNVSASLLRRHGPEFLHLRTLKASTLEVVFPHHGWKHSWGETAWMCMASLATTSQQSLVTKNRPLLHKWSWIFIHYSTTDISWKILGMLKFWCRNSALDNRARQQ